MSVINGNTNTQNHENSYGSIAQTHIPRVYDDSARTIDPVWKETEIQPYSAVRYRERKFEVGISAYGNIWQINKDRVDCNGKVVAMICDPEPVLIPGAKIKTVETYGNNAGKRVESDIIIKVSELTERELDDLMGALEKLREAYGFVKIVKNNLNGFDILGIDNGEYEVVGQLSQNGTIMNYGISRSTAYEKDKEYFDSEINADYVDDDFFKHIKTDDDISDFLCFIMEDMCLNKEMQQEYNKLNHNKGYKDKYTRFLEDMPLKDEDYNDLNKIKVPFDKSKIYNEEIDPR